MALASKAREILGGLGFESAPVDLVYGYASADARPLPGVVTWQALPTVRDRPDPVVRFWYRQHSHSPMPAGSARPFTTYADPSLDSPGGVGVQLDPDGRLLRLDATPSLQSTGDTQRPPEPSWKALFAAAGLELGAFRATSGAWTPRGYADHTHVWEGSSPRWPERLVRVEAAAVQGVPTEFRVRPQRASDARDAEGGGPGIMDRCSRLALAIWFGSSLLAAVVLTRSNLRRRIADRPAAFRVAVAVFAARLLAWLLGAHHVAAEQQLAVFQDALARSVLDAFIVWIIYIALEPTFRALRSDSAASWVRLLNGRIRDSLVGRDVLIGASFGAGALLWQQLYSVVPPLLGLPAPRREALGSLVWQLDHVGLALHLEALAGIRNALAVQIYTLVHGLLVSVFGVAGLALLWLIIRRVGPAIFLAFLALTLILFPAAGDPLLDLLAAAIAGGIWLYALVRFGFLAAASATAVAALSSSQPVVYAPSSWAFPSSVVPLLLVLLAIFWAFFTSLGSESALALRPLDGPSEGASLAESGRTDT